MLHFAEISISGKYFSFILILFMLGFPFQRNKINKKCVYISLFLGVEYIIHLFLSLINRYSITTYNKKWVELFVERSVHLTQHWPMRIVFFSIIYTNFSLFLNRIKLMCGHIAIHTIYKLGNVKKNFYENRLFFFILSISKFSLIIKCSLCCFFFLFFFFV